MCLHISMIGINGICLDTIAEDDPPPPPLHSSLNSHRQKEFIAHLYSLPLSSTSYLFPGLCYPFKSEIWTKESRRNYLATLLATK